MNKDDLRVSIEDIPNVTDIIISEDVGDEKFNFSFKIKKSKYFCIGVYSADGKRIKWLEINAVMKAKESLDINERFKIINHVNKHDKLGCSTSYIEEISAFIISSNMLVLPNAFYVADKRSSAYKIMIMESIVGIFGSIKILKEATNKCINEETISSEDENEGLEGLRDHEQER